MKSTEFADALRASAKLASRFEQSRAASQLEQAAVLFDAAGTLTVAAVLKMCGGLEVEPSRLLGASTRHLQDVADYLVEFARGTGGKKALVNDLNALSSWLEQYPAADLDGLLAEATATINRPTPKKLTKANEGANATIVRYLQRLDETYGFCSDFDPLFDELQSDSAMKAAQLKKLAKLFTNQTASSGEQALRLIYRKHSNIVEADRHKAARGGRVAG